MFTQKEEGFEGTTVIAEGVKVEGNFKGDGPMVIDGIIKGTVATSKSVEVGKTASIEANIKAGSVVIAGHVKGNINAKSRLELLPGSQVEGDVTSKILVISEGAILNGKCSMGNNVESAPIPEETPSKQTSSKNKEVSKLKTNHKNRSL